MKLLGFLFMLLLLAALSCNNPSSANPHGDKDSTCFGDTVCVDFSFVSRRDSLERLVLDFTLELSNQTDRPLALDSLQSETWIEIIPDTTGLPTWIWRSPETYQPDSVVHSVVLLPDSVSRYRDTWPRIDDYGAPIPQGRYRIRAKIMGFPAPELRYDEL